MGAKGCAPWPRAPRTHSRAVSALSMGAEGCARCPRAPPTQPRAVSVASMGVVRSLYASIQVAPPKHKHAVSALSMGAKGHVRFQVAPPTQKHAVSALSMGATGCARWQLAPRTQEHAVSALSTGATGCACSQAAPPTRTRVASVQTIGAMVCGRVHVSRLHSPSTRTQKWQEEAQRLVCELLVWYHFWCFFVLHLRSKVQRQSSGQTGFKISLYVAYSTGMRTDLCALGRPGGRAPAECASACVRVD
jgi:hypothetical protein